MKPKKKFFARIILFGIQESKTNNIQREADSGMQSHLDFLGKQT
jgi:hypothetical protein